MKRFFALALSAMLALTCACQKAPAPEPTAEPVPTGGLELWLYRAQERYNMKYDGFAGYLEMLCDDVYSDSVRAMLDILPMPEMDAEVSAKRAEFAEKYGKSWSYEISGVQQTELSGKTCENFAAELRTLSERISVFPNEAKGWSEAQWAEFAGSLGVSESDARALADIYSAMAAAVADPDVTRALDLELTLTFSDGSKRTEHSTVYEVNGRFVSQDIIDVTGMVINFIYGRS